ncbi:MAG: hypothetical protein Tsb0033_26970 [Winogradskyella sp.]
MIDFFFKKYIIALCLNLCFFISLGQEKSDQGYLYPIEQKDAIYDGQGVKWLLANAKNSQYVLFGEQHGVKQLGDFISFTLKELKSEGYTNLGVEMDVWSTKLIEAKGLENFISKYPNSFAFGYDGELKMIQYALEKNVNLIGLDQMLTAVHPYQRLIDLSETSAQRRLSRGAFLKASLKMGEYLREEHFEDLEILKATFSDNQSKEVYQILNELETSMCIYTTWRAGQRGEVSKQKSPQMREDMMKKKFDLWTTKNNINKTSKTIFKMGGAHLMYGVGPNGIETLGEHIRQKTSNLGLQTFSVGIRNFDPKSALVTENDFGDADAIVIDVDKLRDKIVKDTLEIRNYDSNRLSINGYDAIIYFKNPQWSSRKIISKYKDAFKSRFIKSVIPMAVLFVLCLISVFVYTGTIFKRKFKPIKNSVIMALFSTIFLCSLFVYQLVELRKSSPESADLWSANTSFVLYIFLGVLSISYLFLGIKNVRHQSHTIAFKIYFQIMAIIFSSLAGYCYYWNIGGMI